MSATALPLRGPALVGASVWGAAWAVVAVSLGLFAPEAGAVHFMQWTVCSAPDAPCYLSGYGPAEWATSLPAFLAWSGVPVVLMAGWVVGRQTPAPSRPPVRIVGLGLVVAAIQFYGLGVAKALYVKLGAGQLESAFFYGSVGLGLALAAALVVYAARPGPSASAP